jgi:anti-sigma B factor antagonist
MSDNIFTIVLPEEISNQDVLECEKLINKFNKIEIKDNILVIIDFINVKYIASQALGIILDFNNKINKFNSKMALCNVNEYIQNVMSVLGFSTIIDIYDTNIEAIKNFEKK